MGYARVVTSHVPLPDGSTAATDFIFNSGFYLTPDSVFVQRLLAAVADGGTSILFGVRRCPKTATRWPGDAVAVSAAAPHPPTWCTLPPARPGPGRPSPTSAPPPTATAWRRFPWDTLDLPDDDYELVALYTEDDGRTVVYDSVEVSVDNVLDVSDPDDSSSGSGGCTAAPLLPGGGGPTDPTLPALVGLVLAWLLLARRRPMVMAIAVLRTPCRGSVRYLPQCRTLKQGPTREMYASRRTLAMKTALSPRRPCRTLFTTLAFAVFLSVAPAGAQEMGPMIEWPFVRRR